MSYVCPACGGEVVCIQAKPGGWFVGFGPLGCIGGLIAWLWMNRTRTRWQCITCGLVCSLPVTSPAPLTQWVRERAPAEIERQRELNDYYHRKSVLEYVRHREDKNDYENQYYPAWYHPPAPEKVGKGGPISIEEIAQEIGEGLYDGEPSAEVMVARVSLIVDQLKAEELIEEVSGGLVQATATTMELSVPEVKAQGLEDMDGEWDELFDEALRITVEMKSASPSVLQRRLLIGYGRATAILDMMEREGLIGQGDGLRPRPVLARAYKMVKGYDGSQQ
jgi:hypothetical protein